MKNLKIISNCELDTLNFAKTLASKLQNGDILILNGDLGAGKTKFTEGILSYFDLQDEISSPTFSIVNEYIKDDINIYHFDVYRLNSSSEFYEIGGEEYFDNGICIIEWGNIIQDILPNSYIQIDFEKDEEKENTRILNISTIGDKFDTYFE